FYNTVWLIVNDIILGLTLGGFLMTNSNILALQFLSLCDVSAQGITGPLSLRYYFQYFTQDGITVVIDWLMGWPPPAGLKLNSELNGFLGQLFLWILQIWK
ncbi:phosphatidylinositol N-acetylglucosaminyltransferase subunit gpi1, partial [Rhizoclosmatium hyalinum]